MKPRKHGFRFRASLGRLVMAIGLACAAATLSTCTLGLLDLVAFQVLSNESAMLYLGYHENGFGVARMGVSTGALEVFRDTVSESSTSGCSVGLDPRAMVPGVFFPRLYYAAEAPNRVMSTLYNGVEPPAQLNSAEPMAATTCVRAFGSATEPLAVYWSTLYTMHVSNEVGVSSPLSLGNGIMVSFDVDQSLTPDRLYYLGLLPATPESDFGIVAVDSNGGNVDQIYVIGRYLISNLLLVDGYLYYVTQDPHGIWRIKADSSEPAPTLLLTPTAAPQAVAYDKIDGILYWIEVDESTPRRIMKAGPGQTAGTPLLEYLPKIDANGFCLYRP